MILSGPYLWNRYSQRLQIECAAGSCGLILHCCLPSNSLRYFFFFFFFSATILSGVEFFIFEGSLLGRIQGDREPVSLLLLFLLLLLILCVLVFYMFSFFVFVFFSYWFSLLLFALFRFSILCLAVSSSRSVSLPPFTVSFSSFLFFLPMLCSLFAFGFSFPPPFSSSFLPLSLFLFFVPVVVFFFLL